MYVTTAPIIPLECMLGCYIDKNAVSLDEKKKIMMYIWILQYAQLLKNKTLPHQWRRYGES